MMDVQASPIGDPWTILRQEWDGGEITFIAVSVGDSGSYLQKRRGIRRTTVADRNVHSRSQAERISRRYDERQQLIEAEGE